MEKEEKKIYVFEEPIKPELEDIKEVIPNTEDFINPEKAEALIRSLNLNVGENLREDGTDGEEYTINPKMVLEGDKPEKYKREIEEVKVILTDKEKESISLYFKSKKENPKIRNKIYYRITKRVNKLYKWDDENKKHIPKTNSKRSLEICKGLDWIGDNNLMSGFDNLIYHLLSKEKTDYVYCYKCAWFEKPIPNIQKWNEKYDGCYRVLTDSESDSACEDYLDDDYMWKQAVESGNTTSSLEDWKQDVINMDGRGSLLNSYDGCEESETINGTDYYIYRTN